MIPSLAGKKAADYYWYHTIDLLNGIVVPGDYDINAVLHYYHFPDDMSDLSVRDVGRGSGAFAFEFERRGAHVVATDISSYLDWDFMGGEPERQRRAPQIGDPRTFSEKFIFGSFEYARQTRGSKVEGKYINVYDLSPEAFSGRTFDIVFAGSITSHLRDPMLAMERLFSVTKTKCIVSAPTFEIDGSDAPLMCLVTGDTDRRSWWILNRRALIEMLSCVGFSKVDIVSRFALHNQRNGMSYDHVVAHATI